jgi:hypothetical protein
MHENVRISTVIPTIIAQITVPIETMCNNLNRAADRCDIHWDALKKLLLNTLFIYLY